MSKEVTYSVVARKNMLKKDDPAKYYAQAQASGDVGAGRDLDPGGKGLYGTFGGCRGSTEGAGG